MDRHDQQLLERQLRNTSGTARLPQAFLATFIAFAFVVGLAVGAGIAPENPDHLSGKLQNFPVIALN